MVKVREDYLITESGEVDFQHWAQKLIEVAELDSSACDKLIDAARFAYEAEQRKAVVSNLWTEDASSTLTGLEMADILAGLQLDHEALMASVIYRSVREHKASIEEVTEKFGGTVGKLIEGVLGMAAISQLRNDSEEGVFGRHSAEQTENVRKMLVAMIDDVRVALIKLAERTCAIRAVKNADEHRRRKVAREVFDIYAPLAHRLGIGHIKWELEDLGFRYLMPDDYKSIAKLLDEKRLARQHYINHVVESLNTQIGKSGIEADVYGRAKHIYSIWRKMQRKGIGFSEVYDIRAIRILVPSTKDCYEVLGIVHTLWRNIPHEFDDYIAAPKENGYRSLHTAVHGPENKVVEVQIRTHTMHDEAEYGVCSHWRYKGTDSDGNSTQDSYEQKIEWLRQVLDWHEELGVEGVSDDIGAIEEDRIYLFTPDGHVLDLPARATPLDFAYRVHTDVGHRCRGAKVNGRIAPLNHILKTGDQVEILTGKESAPSRDWLMESLGYLNTSRARAKVRYWLSQQNKEKNLAEGKELLEKEFKRLGLGGFNQTTLLASMKYQTLDELYMHIGSGDVGINQVVKLAQKLLSPPEESSTPRLVTKKSSGSAGNDIYIEGVGNMMTSMAQCCSPVPGDDIKGYITIGRGVSIHRGDCRNMLQLETDEPDRIIRVSWGESPTQTYSVDIAVEAYDRGGLLRDITVLLDTASINVTAMQTSSDQNSHTANMVITADIRDFEQLSHVLVRLNQLPNIISAHRKQ